MVPAQVELHWSEGVEVVCEARTPLHDAVRARLGYDPVQPAAERTMQLSLEPDGDRLVLTVREGEAERRFVGPCEDVVADAALAVAMALDPLRAAAAPPAPPPPEPEPPAATVASPPTAQAGRATRVWLGVQSGPALAQQPGMSWRFGASAGLSWRRLHGELLLELGLPTHLDSIWRERDVRVRVWPQRLGGAVQYAAWQSGAWSVAPRAGFSLLRWSVAGEGTDTDRSTQPLQGQVELGLRGQWQATPRAPRLYLAASATVATHRMRLLLDDQGQSHALWQAPPLGLDLRLGVQFGL